MIMDTLAAVSLATEPPHPSELRKERVKAKDAIIVPAMQRNVLVQSGYQFLVMVVLLYFAPLMYGINYHYIDEVFYKDGKATNKAVHYTLLFHTFVLMQLFNQINSRKLGIKDFNVFERFANNFNFLLILAAEFTV